MKFLQRNVPNKAPAMLYEETLFISWRIFAIKEVNDLAQGLEKLKRWYGSSFGFRDYDSGKRGFSGATFDHWFANSFATMKKCVSN